MPPFSSKSLHENPVLAIVRRHPFVLFGLPFLSLIVGSSFALQALTRTRYDLQAQKVSRMSMEDELGMSKSRKKVDLREEYYRLSNPELASQMAGLDASSSMSSFSGAAGGDEGEERESLNQKRKKNKKFSMVPVSQDQLENVRVGRPEGVPEWGGGPGQEEAPVKGKRKEDRWV